MGLVVCGNHVRMTFGYYLVKTFPEKETIINVWSNKEDLINTNFGQVFYQNLLNMQEKLSTSEAPKQFDMSYMGFSLCMGNFDGDSEEDVAVGVPRGSSLKGMVVLFNHRLEVLYNITGDQIGSYFGYSIAVLDYDGDGLDDVAVGSPWHTQIGNPSLLYEEGSVSLFKHTLQHNFRRTQKLFGKKSRSHFGLSMTSLKDLNGDGFEDLAVGAPRDGKDQKGAVYIFLGGPSGLIEKPAQTIFAEDLAKPAINSFGWALSGGLDLDQNEYPDLAVGAHESNKVIIFRTRPIVSVDASVKYQE
ncbi:Integrin alpha-PS2 [Armadillidium nasatum]|uniref:Integrin alpha-PS2 n=1 Tax=Armadillidium nasatum TaxID=96803 RepID=A0A5N5TDD1_9CRUS|nr:Integrin alpha-PS2 [Armadillidium nasatum]